MPWKTEDVDSHKKGLDESQKKRWVSIANSVLKQCEKDGGKDCEGKAVRIANAKCEGSEESLKEILAEFAKEEGASGEKGFAKESFAAEGARIDPDGGVIFDALAFGPKEKVGPYFKGASGLYSRNFFSSLAAAAEGAYSWPFHPSFDDMGQAIPRDPKAAIARWTGLKEVAKEGLPEVRGKWALRKKHKEDYDLVLESPRSFAFSIFAPTIKKHDPQYGSVHDAIDLDSPWRPSIDLVEAGGANKNAIESAAGQPQPKSKEDYIMEMTQEQLQAKIDEAVKRGNEAQEAKFTAELAKLNRKNLVTEKLATAKLSRTSVSPELIELLENPATPADKLDKIVAEQAKLHADNEPTVTGMGASSQQPPDGGFTIERAVRVGQTRGGVAGIAIEMAGGKRGFESDAASKDSLMKRFAEEIYLRVANWKDQSKETCALRRAVIEGSSLHGNFSACFGVLPMDKNQITRLCGRYQPFEFAMEAVVSTTFTMINQALLSAAMIEAYNIAREGLIGKELVTIYNSPLETERIPGFRRGTGVANVAEGAAFPVMAITPKAVQDYAFTKRGFQVQITREEVLGDQTGRVLMAANDYGQELALDEEENILTGIFELNGKQVYRPVVGNTGVVTALFSGVNTQESNALVDYQNIETAALRLGQQVDENGKYLKDNTKTPFVIVVPWALNFKARRIIGAQYLWMLSGSSATVPAGTARTEVANMYVGTEVKVSQTLMDYTLGWTTWYMAGAGGFQKQYIYKQRIPLEFVPIPPAEVAAVTADIVAGIKGEYLAGVVARDNKYVVKNIAGTAS